MSCPNECAAKGGSPLRRSVVQRYSFRNTFLRLTEYTTPEGNETMWWGLIPGSKFLDRWGNIHVTVLNEDNSLPRIMFSCHLDTVCDSYIKPIQQFITKDGFVYTDGRTTLGADCKTGAALMIQMIWSQVPGKYVFHAGEEVGLIGSSGLSEFLINRPKKVEEYDYCVAFDRAGYSDIITHQCQQRTCSDEFAKALSTALNLEPLFEYEPCPKGSFTDSYCYKNIIPECTNLSVGYFLQHTVEEEQDLLFAELLLKRLISIQWSKLPVSRDPSKPDIESTLGLCSQKKYKVKYALCRVCHEVKIKENGWSSLGEFTCQECYNAKKNKIKAEADGVSKADVKTDVVLIEQK